MEEKVEVCPWCKGRVIWNVTYDHYFSSGMAYCDRAKYVPKNNSSGRV